MNAFQGWFAGRSRIRILPYPEGKLFAFTIVDDTDGQTLETVRPVYDELASLGLRTTKTVWVKRPAAEPSRRCDQGDTLERCCYVDYLKQLQDKGFELALHNVSSQSNKRADVIEGIEQFRNIFGAYPKINVHHEKNLENLYCDVAHNANRIPQPYRSALFRRIHRLRSLLRRRETEDSAPRRQECSGENPESEYFWGDICKSRIKYVRSNVFITDLNTVKLCPSMPEPFPDTPYVNYWFYSSEGQNSTVFNRILNRRNIRKLQIEHGCSILYTHFGKGFTIQVNGRYELNERTKHGLRGIAAAQDGWFAPAGDILDRLLAFQNVFCSALSSGAAAIRNRNPFEILAATVLGKAGASYYADDGRAFQADQQGRVVIPVLRKGETLFLFDRDPALGMKRWNSPLAPGIVSDLKHLGNRTVDRLAGYWDQRRHQASGPQQVRR